MKRIISLFLALALLFSLAPAVFAEGTESNEQAGVALVLGKPEKKTATEYQTNANVVYYRIPVKVKNMTSEELSLNMLECYVQYDKSNFSCDDIQTGSDDFIDAFEVNEKIKEWGGKERSAKNGIITFAAAGDVKSSRYWIKVEANGEAELFAINLSCRY